MHEKERRMAGGAEKVDKGSAAGRGGTVGSVLNEEKEEEIGK